MTHMTPHQARDTYNYLVHLKVLYLHVVKELTNEQIFTLLPAILDSAAHDLTVYGKVSK